MINIYYRNGLCVPNKRLLKNNDTGFIIQSHCELGLDTQYPRIAPAMYLDRGVLVTFQKLSEGLGAMDKLASIRIPYLADTKNRILFKTSLKLMEGSYEFYYDFDREYRIEPHGNAAIFHNGIDYANNPLKLCARIKDLYRRFIVSLAMNLSKDFGKSPLEYSLVIDDINFKHIAINGSPQVEVDHLDYTLMDSDKHPVGTTPEIDDAIEYLIKRILNNSLCVDEIKYSFKSMILGERYQP